MTLLTDLFLAWRYLKPKRNAVSVITCISVIGVILGVAVLIIVLAVMTGFTDEFKKKILETSAHIQIEDRFRGFIADPDSIITEAEKLGAEAAPVVQRPVLVQRGDRFLPKMVIGFVPAKESITVQISEAIKYGNENVFNNGNFQLKRGQVLLSTVMCRQLGVTLDDKIILHSPTKLAKMIRVDDKGQVQMNKINKVYLPAEFKVAGIFSFGKFDFDQSVLFINIDDADELFGMPWGSATAVYVKTKDPFNLNKELDGLQAALPELSVLSWQQLNQRFLGVLEVEKNMQFFLLIFIVLIAAFSIANTLITVVVQKTREIGLLKALGAGDGTVLRIFLCQGFLVGLLGTVFGIVFGSLMLYWRNDILKFIRMVTGQEVFPAEFYFFNDLPASIHISDIILIALTSITLCTLGGLIPAWRAARLDPAKALRYE